MPAFPTAAAHAFTAVNNEVSKIVNSPVAPGYFFFCSSTKLVTVIHSVSINQKSRNINTSAVVSRRNNVFFYVRGQEDVKCLKDQI